MAAVLVAACGKSDNTNVSGATQALAPSGFTRAEYKEFPVTVSFDFNGFSNQVFEVFECVGINCSSYMKVSCSTGSCSLLDGLTGKLRTNFALKSSNMNGKLHIEWSDLVINSFNSTMTKIELRASGVATIEATRNNSLPTVSNR